MRKVIKQKLKPDKTGFISVTLKTDLDKFSLEPAPQKLRSPDTSYQIDIFSLSY